MIYPIPASTLVQPLQPPGLAWRRNQAFTLIETALALGIVAFALVPLIGLLPLGLQISHSASDLTLSAQITQRLAGTIQQADYSSYRGLVDVYYYFDAEGQPLKSTTGEVPASAIYAASIFLPSAEDPATSASLVDGANVAVG